MGEILDVSKFQGVIDWSKVPYDTVIIRMGYRASTSGKLCADSQMKANLAGARKYNKKIGVYFYTQAVNIEEARKEAEFCCKHCGVIDLPVFIDSEYSPSHKGRADVLTKDARTVCVMAFCTRVMEMGFTAGVYASQDWYKNQLDYEKLKHYKIWVARYSTNEPNYPPKWDIWQYTSKAKCDGITGYVDVSKTAKVEPAQKPTATATETSHIMIAQASYGESGPRNQIAGNQNGKELNFADYKESKYAGWRRFRAPYLPAQHKIAFAAISAVNNKCIGYDQNNRNTLFVASQKYGYDPGAVSIDVECDCSSLVRVCCAYAGIMLPDFNTASEPKVLLNAGFTEVTDQPFALGDIIVTKTKGHTAIICQVS